MLWVFRPFFLFIPNKPLSPISIPFLFKCNPHFLVALFLLGIYLTFFLGFPGEGKGHPPFFSDPGPHPVGDRRSDKTFIPFHSKKITFSPPFNDPFFGVPPKRANFILAKDFFEKNLREGFVKYVIDGDTVVLSNGERLRYAGMDAPELKEWQEGKWVEVHQPFGVSAFHFNRDSVNHRKVTFEIAEKERDVYGRLLVYLYRDGVMINTLLVQEGLARVTLYPPNLKYADLFLNLQRQAWEKRRGLWAFPWPYNKGISRENHFR